MLWLAGSIPLVLASVWEEKMFGDEPVDVTWMCAWSTFWQVTYLIDRMELFVDGI
jgi:hypothetical protein